MKRNIQIINMILIDLKLNFKSSIKLNKELDKLKKYVKDSNLFNGKKKKIYTKINKYKI